MGLIWLNNNRPAPSPPASPGEDGEARSVSTAACDGQIWYVVRSLAEVRFGYEGQAAQIRLEWPGGSYEAKVEDSCSGTDCKVYLPRPGLSEVRIRLDECPWAKAP